MCGINGFSFKDKALIIEMNKSIAHRGPDGLSEYLDENVSLGHARLSIIDLSKEASQPMFYSYLGRKVSIVFNGEIYNYIELKQRLIGLGHCFSNASDTEVIMAAYLEWGEEAVNEFNGMWAFCLYDIDNRTLFCSRDRLGVKPFYYYQKSEKFVFSSELKGILRHEALQINTLANINQEAVELYFSLGYIPAPTTIYDNVFKLEAGSNLIYNLQDQKISKKYKYYRAPAKQKDNSNAQLVEEGKDLIKDSVKLRMRSDVPVGAFLSGGVDSSSVVSMMSGISNRPIKTFSIGFKEQEFDETKYAKLVANKFQTDHHEMIVEPESIDLLPELVNLFDEPFADSSAVPMYYLSKFAREHVTVALSGDGGDELFAGYSRYNNMIKLHNRPFNNSFINTIASSVHNVTPDYLELKKWSYYFGIDSNYIGAAMGIFKPYERKKLYKDWVIDELDEYESEIDKIELCKNFSGDFISRMQNLDLNTYLVDDVLTKVDRASMGNSLEVRVPILDHKFVELAATIPSEFKINSSDQKIIFKDAMRNILPDQILSHKKQGFSVPVSSWFREDLKDYLSETLLSSDAKINNYLCKDEISKIVMNHNKGMRDFSSKIWSLLFLEEWLKKN